MTEYTLPSTGKLPGYIITGPDGNMWFTETGRSDASLPVAWSPSFRYLGNVNPTGITIGPGKSFRFIVGNEILRVSMTGHVTESCYLPVIDRPIGSVVTARDGTIWFAIPGAQIVLRPIQPTAH